MAEKKSLILSVSLLILNLGIIVTVYFFPFLFAFAVVLLIPLTAYLGKRTRLWGIILSSVFAVVLVTVVNKLFLWMLSPLYAFGVAGVMNAIGKKTGVGFIWCTGGVLIGLLSMFAAVAATEHLNFMDASAEFIRTTDNVYIVRQARAYEVEERLSKMDISKSEYGNVKKQIQQEVEQMDAAPLLEKYAQAVRYDLYANLMKYFGFLLPVITCFSYWASLILVRLFQKSFVRTDNWQLIRTHQYAVSPLNEWQMPKGYLVGVFPLMILLFLIGKNVDFMNAVFSFGYQFMVIVPFSVTALSVISYLFTRKGKHYVPAVITVLVLLVFLWPFLPVVGVADHMLKTRKLIKMFDETDSI